MRALFIGIHFALFFLAIRGCCAQQSNQLVYIEGKTQKADGAPLVGVPVLFSNGSSVVTNSSGHYFNVVPSGFAGSSTANQNGINFSPLNRSYNNISVDQLNQDFSGGTYTVSGQVWSRFKSVFPNVALYFDSFWQGTVSGSDGTFTLTIPQGYSGTVTPMFIGSTFNPIHGSYPGQLFTTFTEATYTSDESLMSLSNSIQTRCYYADSSYLFPPGTAAIYARANGYPGDTFNFSWYDPSGTLRRQSSTTVTDQSVGGCATDALPILGTGNAQSPGLWRVDILGQPGRAFESGSLTFAVLPQQTPVTVPPTLGSMADLASGGGWDTTIELVNVGGVNAQTSVGFFGDDGSPLSLPVVPGLPPTSRIARAVTPNATLLIDSIGSDALQTGYAQLNRDAGIEGFIRFRYAPRDQEAIVPLETRNASSYLLAFDNTNGIATGAAVANLTALPANIPVLIRDNTGAQIGSASVSLPANGHASFVLSDHFASTANQTGTIEFDTPVGGQISVLGLRFPPSERFTTIPVIANNDPGGGLMAHLAVGDGWTTTIELVNSGSKFAQAHVKFFNDNGTPLALPWTLSGTSTTAASLDQVMAPHARIVIESSAADGDALQIGSAQLTTDGSVSGFIRFRYGPRDQEALVPIEARNASSYILPFDNTNGLAAGVAIAGAMGAPANIPVLVRDSTGTRIGVGIVAVPANGHTAFVLSDQFPITANASGTVEFATPANGQLSVLGFRFPQSGAFSTIPVLAP